MHPKQMILRLNTTHYRRRTFDRLILFVLHLISLMNILCTIYYANWEIWETSLMYDEEKEH